MEISGILLGLEETARPAQVLGSPADQRHLWTEAFVTVSGTTATRLDESGCSPVWCDDCSSWTQLLRSHLCHQTHPRINEGSIVEKASLKVNVYWCNNIPVHAIWSLCGNWPPVQRKLSVTGILGLSVMMPSASRAWRMHSSLCGVEKRVETSYLENNTQKWPPKLTLSPSLAWTSFRCTTLLFLVRKKSFSRWVLSSCSSVHRTDRSDRLYLLGSGRRLAHLCTMVLITCVRKPSPAWNNVKPWFPRKFNEVKMIILSLF